MITGHNRRALARDVGHALNPWVKRQFDQRPKRNVLEEAVDLVTLRHPPTLAMRLGPTQFASARTPLEWLLAHDLIVATSDNTVVMPREVALAIRHGALLTDVSAERYWTVVAEIHVASLETYTETSRKSMQMKEFQDAMQGYHDLIEHGRREIYMLET